MDFDQSTGKLLYDDGQGNTLPYRLYLPAGYDPGGHYPLVIFFHGAGERGTDNTSPSTGGGHMENLYQAAQGAFGDQYKALLLVPQCPTSDQWVNWPWGNGSYTQAQEPPVGRSMQSALAILDLVIASYPVDADRVYVTGLSMGGFGTWNAVRLRPGQFAAAMPLSGGGNVDQGALLMATPVWAYHGTADSIVPVSGTDAMRDAIESAGGAMNYTRVNAGHSGWGMFYDNSTYSDAGGQSVYEWLFSQSLASTVVSSPDTVDADGLATATITVALEGGDGNPLVGKTVTLTSNRGVLDTISAASGPSDSGGLVTFTVSSTTPGMATFTATNTTDGEALARLAVVMFAALPPPGVVIVEEHRSTIGTFTTVPNPSDSDFADAGSGNGVTIEIPAGAGQGHPGVGGSSPRARLHDGLGVTSLGNLGEVFAFADPGHGRLRMDLQASIPIAEINTFSTHEIDERIAQQYSVYGSNADLAGTGDPVAEGWSLIATVSQDYNRGIAGVSVRHSEPGAPIGSFRYLLFTILPSFDNEATEYFEIDVVEAVVADYDGDGFNDEVDAFPDDPDEWLDTDSDLIGNNADPDDDNDGLTDEEEGTIGTEPLIVDTDEDGLSDGDEVNVHGSNPLVKDSDGDGLEDGDEIAAGTNVLVRDTDEDGLLDGEEAAYGANPLLKDTDGDTYLDGFEVSTGFDPASGASTPDLFSTIHTAVEVRFSASTAETYRVEASPDTDNWTVIEEGIEGNGALMSRLYVIDGTTFRAFRVRRE